MATVFETPADLKNAIGKQLGVSDWLEIDQQRIDKFADATGDHQWIHLDVERCKKESPYGCTIAHGYYTLSLMPMLMAQVWKLTGARMGVNYGLNKLRFPAPVPVGKKVRAHATLQDCKEIEGGYHMSSPQKLKLKTRKNQSPQLKPSLERIPN